MSDWVQHMSTTEAKWASMIKLGASVEELAKETIQDLLGFDGSKEEGHRPPRADIQKLKEVNEFHDLAFTRSADVPDAKQAWSEQYHLNEREIKAVDLYLNLTQQQYMSEKQAFEQLVSGLHAESVRDDPKPETEADTKKFLGDALRKYEQQNWPRLYKTIETALNDAYRSNNESYKLWPWLVKQLKEAFHTWLFSPSGERSMWGANNQINRPEFQGNLDPGHYVDIVTEAGPILAELRRQNRTPKDLDVNQMNFKELEDWLMDWKRENRASESQGEPVYEFKDGWTIQRLTTPEQLQYEGDEMGHCVGGYGDAVEANDSIIYSLRDRQGEPHATIEVQGETGAKSISDKPIKDWTAEETTQYLGTGQRPHALAKMRVMPHLENAEDVQHYNRLQNEGRKDLIDQQYPDYAHLHQPNFAPNDIPDDLWVYPGRKHDKTFGVIQVQGQGNSTPKPEYAAKIKEFFTSLKEETGVNFQRSDDWYNPHDQYNEDELENPDNINEAGGLDKWHDEVYAENWSQYHGEGDDEYGLQNTVKALYNFDPQQAMESSAASLLDDYDRDRYKTSDWKGLAEATYRASVLGGFDQPIFEQNRQRAEETLHEWMFDYVDQTMYHDSGAYDEIIRTFEEMANEQGINIETVYEAGQGFDREVAQDQFEVLWQDASDKWREEQENWYAGNAYKYFQYLYMLGEYYPWPHPKDLPQPGEFPKFEDLQSKLETAPTDLPKSDTVGQPAIPGALSSWDKPGLKRGDTIINLRTMEVGQVAVTLPDKVITMMQDSWPINEVQLYPVEGDYQMQVGQDEQGKLSAWQRNPKFQPGQFVAPAKGGQAYEVIGLASGPAGAKLDGSRVYYIIEDKAGRDRRVMAEDELWPVTGTRQLSIDEEPFNALYDDQEHYANVIEGESDPAEFNIEDYQPKTAGWELPEYGDLPEPGSEWLAHSSDGEYIYKIDHIKDHGGYVDDPAVWFALYKDGKPIGGGHVTAADWAIYRQTGLMVPKGEDMQMRIMGGWEKKEEPDWREQPPLNTFSPGDPVAWADPDYKPDARGTVMRVIDGVGVEVMWPNSMGVVRPHQIRQAGWNEPEQKFKEGDRVFHVLDPQSAGTVQSVRWDNPWYEGEPKVSVLWDETANIGVWSGRDLAQEGEGQPSLFIDRTDKTAAWIQHGPQAGERYRYLDQPHGTRSLDEPDEVYANDVAFTVESVDDQKVLTIDDYGTRGFIQLQPFLVAVEQGYMVPEEDQFKLASGWAKEPEPQTGWERIHTDKQLALTPHYERGTRVTVNGDVGSQFYDRGETGTVLHNMPDGNVYVKWQTNRTPAIVPAELLKKAEGPYDWHNDDIIDPDDSGIREDYA